MLADTPSHRKDLLCKIVVQTVMLLWLDLKFLVLGRVASKFPRIGKDHIPPGHLCVCSVLEAKEYSLAYSFNVSGNQKGLHYVPSYQLFGFIFLSLKEI